MKVNFRLFLTMAVVSLFLVAGAVNADTPGVSITSPTGTIFTTSFPFTTNIVFNLSHSELKGLQALDVQVDGTGIINGGDPVGNPFTNANACSGSLTSAAGVVSCNATDSSNATITVSWQIGAVGTYTITVTVRHLGSEGEDEEIVQVALISAEYPAPPAVANAYINSDAGLKSFIGKRRGCVISKIAEQHAKYEAYGPKGGPYNESDIQSDVNAFSSYSVCP